MRRLTMLAFVNLAIAAMPAPATAQATVGAGGQRCIQWRFAPQVQGYNDSSYIDMTNTCPAQVSFFMCSVQVFQSGYGPACDPRRGNYSTLTAPPGWSRRSSSSNRGEKVVDIRECPAGTRAESVINGTFNCRR